MASLSIIAAVADNGVIGRDNRLIWRLRSDLKRFRALTMGKPMMVGRATFESIGQPLKGREMIVLTRARDFSHGGVHIAHTLAEAIALGDGLAVRLGTDEVMVAGGAAVYGETLPLVRRLYLTLVHCEPEGDTHFPPYGPQDFRETHREHHAAGPDDEQPFTFVDLVRR